MLRFIDNISDLEGKKAHQESRTLSGRFIVRLEPYLFLIKSPKNISSV